METLRIDPEFRQLIPPLTAEELATLEMNIRRNGCTDPLAIWTPPGETSPILVDGHNRHAICERLGIGYRTREMKFADRKEATAWIILNQLGRRNINASQRAALALKYEGIFAADAAKAKAATQFQPGNTAAAHGGDTKITTVGNAKNAVFDPSEQKSTNSKAAEEKRTRSRLAKLQSVSPITVSRAKVVAKEGVPELEQMVIDGKVGNTSAAKVAKLPKAEQSRIVAEGPDAVKAAAKAVGKPQETPKDEEGHLLPDNAIVRQAFANAERLDKAMQLLTQIAAQINPLLGEAGRSLDDHTPPWPGGELLAEYRQELRKQLKDARHIMEFARPHSLCFCGGEKGCGVCKGRGWVGPLTYKNFTPEDKESIGQRKMEAAA